jgi:hypothetical protein
VAVVQVAQERELLELLTQAVVAVVDMLAQARQEALALSSLDTQTHLLMQAQ